MDDAIVAAISAGAGLVSVLWTMWVVAAIQPDSVVLFAAAVSFLIGLSYLFFGAIVVVERLAPGQGVDA